MRLIIICLVNFIISSSVLSEEVEYYPSQSEIDSHNVKKRSTPVIKNVGEIIFLNESCKSNSSMQWRHFNYKSVADSNVKSARSRRAIDPIFHGHPKTREELWNDRFINKSGAFDQTPSLIKLVHNITLTYLKDCTPVILYDNQVKSQESYLFQNLLKDFPVSYVHGYIDDDNNLKEQDLLKAVEDCLHFIVFLTDISSSVRVLGKQSKSRVVVVARSSQWAVQEFLSGPYSRMFVNLLVIGQSFKDEDDDRIEAPYILYTHKLYIDGLGASKPVVLSSWSHGKYSREVNLFPPKMTGGYAGHRFSVSASNQPPFVFRRIKSDPDGGNPKVTWDGVEVRILHMLAERNNFSIEIFEPQDPSLGAGDAVAKDVTVGRADIGVAGMYMTSDRISDLDMSFSHSQDCAAFVTLMSTALPRYRAILGPFHWHVWVALTFTYLIGILPLAFSDKHSLMHLVHNSGEIENMFWYVFGTFTNCFTFNGKKSWSKTTKVTTRLLIGWYWIFTIIITSCYTGSIIAFVTLPIFPETVDTLQQLLSGFYRIGTLDRGGWERWFFNSSDPNTNKLFRKLELVSNIGYGIRNTTKAFFWPYAFLGSRAELEYIVQANFSKTASKRAQLHISNECFVPFGVSISFPTKSMYSEKLSADLRRMYQTGLIKKLTDEVRWEMQRSTTGKLLSAGSGSINIVSVEEKGLTLEDTQGMFLLLGAGFLLAAFALISEWTGGITKKCRRRKRDPPPAAISQEQLIESFENGYDVKAILSGRTESRLHFDTRPSSAGSVNTLEGQVIDVTEENIIVHTSSDFGTLESRRSSSVDLDREVREIFEKDLKRRREVMGDDIMESSNENREPTVSKGTFGDHINL